MKAAFLFLFAVGVALFARGQTPEAAYSPDQLDQLLGPIGLYPDPLVALILPASTVPADLTQAANYLAGGGNPAGIDAQPWDPSVKGLARYPEVVKWMNDNPDWTQTLGAAFAQQPADVMKSVQQLRAQARAAGTLVDTPQQQVDLEGDDIRIVPAQPDTIYVPEYDPSVVYETPMDYYDGPLITFGVGYPVGAWLSYQCNWDDFGIWIGPWQRGWDYRREWLHPGAWRAWHPDPRRSREVVRNFYRPAGRLPSPGFVGGYRGPVRRPGVAPQAPRPAVAAHPTYRPDYRGREIPAPRAAAPAPSSPLFGGYNRGTQTREFSNRGQGSRAAPVRSLPAPRAAAPSRAPSASPSREKDRH